MGSSDPESVFIIGVAARRLGLHANTLRKYERQGLISPSRSPGNLRLFTADDLTRLEQIKRLVEDRRVNLAGVEVALAVTDRMVAMRQALLGDRQPTSQDLCGAIDDVLAALLAAPDPVGPLARSLEDVHERQQSEPGPRSPRGSPARRQSATRSPAQRGSPRRGGAPGSDRSARPAR